MKEIRYVRTALKALRRMPSDQAELVRKKIEIYAEHPAAMRNNVKQLRGRPGFRLRVGDWRVIFDEDGTVLAILDIGPRGSIYDE